MAGKKRSTGGGAGETTRNKSSLTLSLLGTILAVLAVLGAYILATDSWTSPPPTETNTIPGFDQIIEGDAEFEDLLAKLEGDGDEGALGKARGDVAGETVQPEVLPDIERSVVTFPYHLRWYAPFLSGGGYCSEATGFALELHRSMQNFSLEQHGDVIEPSYLYGLDDVSMKVLSERMTPAESVPDNVVSICHSEPGAWHPAKYETSRCPHEDSVFNIGRTMFETDSLPKGWAPRLNAMDEIWVPSQFQKDVFVKGGVYEHLIHIIGEPVDTDIFTPAVKPVNLNVLTSEWKRSNPYHVPGVTHKSDSKRIARDDSFHFLSIFKWEERKGWDTLFQAYYEEFSSSDNVALFLLTKPFHSDDHDFEEQVMDFFEDRDIFFGKRDDLPRVEILDGQLPQELMPRLYRAADCFVIPSRGEGWGRPHAEAMSMGLPVIATNFSGNLEFMNEDNSYLVNVEKMETIESGAFKGHKWARANVTHLRQLMRQVYEDHEGAQLKGARARRDMVHKFSPTVLVNSLSTHLDRVSNKVTAKLAKSGRGKKTGKKDKRTAQARGNKRVIQRDTTPPPPPPPPPSPRQEERVQTGRERPSYRDAGGRKTEQRVTDSGYRAGEARRRQQRLG